MLTKNASKMRCNSYKRQILFDITEADKQRITKVQIKVSNLEGVRWKKFCGTSPPHSFKVHLLPRTTSNKWSIYEKQIPLNFSIDIPAQSSYKLCFGGLIILYQTLHLSKCVNTECNCKFRLLLLFSGNIWCFLTVYMQ